MSIAELATKTLLRHAIREALNARMEQELPEGAPVTPFPVLPPPGDSLVGPEAGKAALQRGLDEWALKVMEPPGENHKRIDEYIRGEDGLHWPSAALSGSNSTRAYTQNGQFMWCGAFVAWCWAALKPEIRRKHFASTYRLCQWARGTKREVPFALAQPGDIVIVGPFGKRDGSHIAMARTVPRDMDGELFIPTLEGNAKGKGPDDSEYEGVIRRQRPFASRSPSVYRVDLVARPLVTDMQDAV